jgi:hypothetical protein
MRQTRTVSGDGCTLKEYEPILAFPRRDLSVREFTEECGLFVGVKVHVVRWEVNSDTSKGSGRPDLDQSHRDVAG